MLILVPTRARRSLYEGLLSFLVAKNQIQNIKLREHHRISRLNVIKHYVFLFIFKFFFKDIKFTLQYVCEFILDNQTKFNFKYNILINSFLILEMYNIILRRE